MFSRFNMPDGLPYLLAEARRAAQKGGNYHIFTDQNCELLPAFASKHGLPVERVMKVWFQSLENPYNEFAVRPLKCLFDGVNSGKSPLKVLEAIEMEVLRANPELLRKVRAACTESICAKPESKCVRRRKGSRSK
jgi:hypothetical protein